MAIHSNTFDYKVERLRIAKPSQLYTIDEVRLATDTSKGGVYGWWIQNLPAIVPLEGTEFIGPYHLVYVGKSEDAGICGRLDEHFSGCGSYSTLRRSLGVVLKAQLGLVMQFKRWKRPKLKQGPRFGWGETENKLSAWMSENARVVWTKTDDHANVERSLMRNHYLPLNLLGNKSRNGFYIPLSALRKSSELEAFSRYRTLE